MLNDAVAIARLPVAERRQRFADFDTRLDADLARNAIYRLVPKIGNWDCNVTSTATCLDALVVALAAERYRLRHGSWPTDLAKLKLERPPLLMAVPLDAADSKPLGYHSFPGAMTVSTRSGWTMCGGGFYDPDATGPPCVELLDEAERRVPHLPPVSPVGVPSDMLEAAR